MSRRRATDLEARLSEWGKEYGGGKYESLGNLTSPLESLMKWHGKPPSGLNQVPMCTAADEVQEAVEALATQPQGLIPAMVLRCEYLTPAQPVESKVQRLRKAGENLCRVRYYQHLRIARIHVAGWLHIPFCEDGEEVTEAVV